MAGLDSAALPPHSVRISKKARRIILRMVTGKEIGRAHV